MYTSVLIELETYKLFQITKYTFFNINLKGNKWETSGNIYLNRKKPLPWVFLNVKLA